MWYVIQLTPSEKNLDYCVYVLYGIFNYYTPRKNELLAYQTLVMRGIKRQYKNKTIEHNRAVWEQRQISLLSILIIAYTLKLRNKNMWIHVVINLT